MKKNVLEILELYDEFLAKCDRAEPIHYSQWTNDKYGGHVTVSRLYGVAKDGHLIAFEGRIPFSGPNKERAEAAAREWIEGFALPIGATPGRLRMLKGVPE